MARQKGDVELEGGWARLLQLIESKAIINLDKLQLRLYDVHLLRLRKENSRR
jgi:hypothetical protein